MTTKTWMAGALIAPLLVFAMSAGAAGGSVGLGAVALLPEDGLIDASVLWPSSDFLKNLCPNDTVGAADCTVVKPRLGGGGPQRPRLDLDDLPQAGEPGLEGLRVDLRFADLAGELAPLATACGVWTGSYELDLTGPSVLFPLWLTAAQGESGSSFTGSFAAVVRFDFLRESDGRRVTLVRTLEAPVSGTWGLLPEGEVPPASSPLWLSLAAPRPPFWRIGCCRLREPPHSPE
ncbi:MAG: hypothetical protein SF066_15055 [Thermoanaerobaculia bacterium]|nr:hypothetical protein [Thermoanaerobaculia bacterium]